MGEAEDSNNFPTNEEQEDDEDDSKEFYRQSALLETQSLTTVFDRQSSIFQNHLPEINTPPPRF